MNSCLPWLVYNSPCHEEAVWQYLILNLNLSTSTSCLWISLPTVLPTRLAPCFLVLYHDKYVLSVLDNQGNKKLALAGAKGSSNCLIDACRCLHIALNLSHAVDPRVTWELMCLGPPSLPLWQSPAASVPLCTLHWAVHCWVMRNDVSHVVESSLFPRFFLIPHICMLYLYQRVGIAMGQCKLLLVSLLNTILPLRIALESQMGSQFLIHRLHALWVAHSTHLLLEMSQKEVWDKECCPSCSSSHEQVMVGKNGSWKLSAVSSLPQTKARLCTLPRCLFWLTVPQAPHGTCIYRDRGCILPVTRNRACSPQLYPSPSMGTQISLPFLPVSPRAEVRVPLPCSPAQTMPWLQDVQSRLHWADWVKAACPALHAPTASMPLSSDCHFCLLHAPCFFAIHRVHLGLSLLLVLNRGSRVVCGPGMC